MTDAERPFFLYVPFNAPHDPRQSPQAFVQQYPLDSIQVPADFLPEYPYKQEIGCYNMGSTATPKILRDERLAHWPRTPDAVRLHRQEYYAIITHMDQQIGRITSDHGLACGHHGLWGKQNMYDHSLRVPLILVGPGVPAAKQIDALVYLQDIMPTTLALAGVNIPPSVDFESLVGFYRDNQQPTEDRDIYACYQLDLQRMIRDRQYKLIVYPQVPVVRLFDIQNDPLEMHDLAREDCAVAKRMFHKLQTLQREMNDPLELEADAFGI